MFIITPGTKVRVSKYRGIPLSSEFHAWVKSFFAIGNEVYYTLTHSHIDLGSNTFFLGDLTIVDENEDSSEG